MRGCGSTCLATALLALTWLDPAAAGLGSDVQESASPPSGAFVDAVVLDASGRPVTMLSPSDLRVTVDGEPRAVLSVRYVFRGTGAEAAARAGAGVVGAAFAAEPSRLVLVVVDENSFGPGAEKAVTSAVRAVGDVLAPGDRLGLATLPEPRDVVADSDRQRFAADLSRIQGRASLANRSAGIPEPQGPGGDRRPPVAERAATAEEPGARPEVPGDPQAPQMEAPPVERTAGAGDPASRTSVDVLADLLQGWRNVQGPKTVIYAWGGTWGANTTDPDSPYRPGRDLQRLIARAAETRTVIHAVAVNQSTRARPDADLERLARDTGGLFAATDGKGAWLGRLAEVMAGGFLVEVEARDGDWDGRTRALSVAVAKPGVSVLAARLWAARDDPLPVAVETPTENAAGTRERGRSRSDATPAMRSDAELDVVIARASEYLQEYMRNFSSVVAEEDYSQTVTRQQRHPGDADRKRVRLRSDVLLLRTSSALDWTPFRDVFEVDGKPVRDREDRLRQLFLEHPDTALEEGERLTRESARYNVGPLGRTINTPTLGLFFLLPQHQARIRFERLDEETFEGIRVWRIGFAEVTGPTLISEANTGKDLPATGEFLIEPATGRVVRTFVRCEDIGYRGDLTVVFRRSDALGMWAPAEMKERYASGGIFVTGDARYTRFRRFQVTTDEHVGVPKVQR